jgi:catecholate siderophore receptor
MRVFLGCSAITLTLGVTGNAWADDAGDDGRTIIVTGRMDGYRAVETTSGTKTSVPILDVPQSISVVTSAQISDQAIRSVADLVRYIPGVSSGQGEGHRDQITLRGNNSTADFFIDGLRDDVQYFRSFYNIDRVEVHKGPNAMIFGRGGGGGILNRVTKGALIDQTLGSVTASGDTFGSVYVAGDANVAFGPAALRLNAFSESLDNHRDAFGGTRFGVNPTLGAQLGERFKVQLSYEYVSDKRVVDRGIPSAFAGTLTMPAGPAIGFRDTYFGARGINDTRFEAHVIHLQTEAALTDSLKFSTQALYGDYDKIYSNAFPVTPVSTTGTVGIEAYRDLVKRKSLVAQGNLEWRVATGGIDHIVLIGGEYTGQDTTSERINGFFDPLVPTAANRRRTVALTNPLVIPAFAFVRGAAGNGNRAVTTDLKQASFYLQDQISFGDKFDLIAGLRYDRFDLGFTNSFTAQRFSRVDDLWSPRVGLVFKPVPQASLYVSYARSYLPQSGDQFLSLDISTAALKPEIFNNYEIGAKWDIKPDLSLTAAVYRLDRGNTRAAGAIAGTTVLTGEQRSKGFELGLSGRITPPWQISLGYAYTDAQITQTTIAAPAGRKVAQVPRHQLSLWNRYDISERFGIGLGVYHQAKQFTTISNLTELPAYTRVDAALFVKVNERINAQINVENLTDTTYFPVAHNDNNISTGAPINARFTLGVKF